MPGRSRLSIRTLAGLLIGAVGLMLIAQSTTLLLIALPGYFGAQRVASLTHADEVAFKTLLYRRLSDLPLIDALTNDRPVDEREAGVIAENRHLVETFYPNAVSELRELDLQGAAAILDNLRFASNAWAEVSAKADAAIHLPKTARDRPSTLDEIARARGAIDASRAAADFIDAAIAPIDPVADRLIEVRRAAWSMRDHLEMLFRAGDPAANDGKPWPIEKIIATAGQRGQAEREWAYLTGIAKRPDTAPALTNAIISAGQWYVGVSQGDQDDLRTLAGGATLTMPAQSEQARQAAALAAMATIITTATDALTERTDELSVDASRSLVIGGTSLVIATLVTLAALLIARHRISRPLLATVRALRCLAERNPDIELPAAGHGEEIEVATNAMLMFRAEIKRSDDQAAVLAEHVATEAQRAAEATAAIDAIRAEQAEKVEPLAQGLLQLAEGDLSCVLVEALPAEYEPLREHFNEALGFLQSAVRHTLTHISTIHANTNGIADEAQALARRTGVHSSTLNQAFAALDALRATFVQSQTDGEVARALAAAASTQAARATQLMASSATAVADISAQTNCLAGLIGQVDELAFAVNLTGLKAGVEAARAGPAGLRAAATAAELGDLSQRANALAGELRQQIEACLQQANDTTRWVRDAGRDVGHIQNQIGEVNTTLDRCVTSARTQSMGLEAFRTLIQHIVQVTEQNLQAAEHTTEAVGALAEETDALKAAMWRFRVDAEAA